MARLDPGSIERIRGVWPGSRPVQGSNAEGQGLLHQGCKLVTVPRRSVPLCLRIAPDLNDGATSYACVGNVESGVRPP